MADEITTLEQPTGAPETAPVTEPVAATVSPTVPVGGDKPTEKSVPLHRFNEVYSQKKELEREIDSLRRQTPPAAPQPPRVNSEPEMKDFGDETNPVAVKRFNEAWVDYRADRKLDEYKQGQERERINNMTDHRRREAGAKLQSNILKASASNPEIHDSVSAIDRYGFHDEFSTVLAESDKSAELIDFMAKNPGEAMRLRGLPLSKSLHELGRIEATLTTGNSGPVHKPTNAPAPPTPVAMEHQTQDIARMSQKDYNAYMNKRMGN